MRPRTPGFQAVCRWPFDAASLAGSSSALAALVPVAAADRIRSSFREIARQSVVGSG